MLRFGACYHPEQWTPDQAKDHIKLMVKARMNVVRMGENAWCKFEPEQGRYRFDWLDPVIEALHKEGISTILCTPTAVAPLWVHTRHPKVLQTFHIGYTSRPGTQHACCVNAPEFQILTDALVQQLARHYANVPGVVGWQIDNRLDYSETLDDRCYCDHCVKVFRQWLLAKYKTTEALNDAWHTACSGVEIRQWNEVVLPHNEIEGGAGAWLDFARFSSDSLIAYHKRQADIVRSACPGRFVSCNAYVSDRNIDVQKLTLHSDTMGIANAYSDEHDHVASAYELSLGRGASGTYWVSEQYCGVPTTRHWRGESALFTPHPGEIRRWCWQAIAHGASGVCFDPFRTALGGSNTGRHGVLDWDGLPRRRYKEVALIGDELKKMAPELEATRVEAKVAVLRSCDALWSDAGDTFHAHTDYEEECMKMFRVVRRTGNTCDVIGPDAELGKYAVVIAPGCTVVDDALAGRLELFAKGGGTLILSPRSGSREVTNARPAMPLPGLFAPIAGITIDEVIWADTEQTVSFARGALIAQTCKVRVWMEVLDCVGAESLAEYTDGRLKGKSAIARRSIGKGQAIYMGVYLPPAELQSFVSEFLPDFPMKDIPDGVEVIQRKGDKLRLVFVLNHTSERQNVKLPGQFPDLLTGETVGPSLTISANGILVLKA